LLASGRQRLALEACMHLREFDRQRDYPAVLALWQTAGPGIHISASDSESELAKKLERDPDLFLVAEQDGALVGSVLGGFDGRRGLVYHLAVAEAWRGQGIGSALMDELEARLTARGCRKAYLLVAADYPDVTAFYQRRGWEVMDVLPMGKEF
jgi:ribosomal protein S18 acetylase RimI-like enzyme